MVHKWVNIYNIIINMIITIYYPPIIITIPNFWHILVYFYEVVLQ